MKTPKKPKAGQVVVLRNSTLDELEIEFVKLMPSQKAAHDWIRETLSEEPGDVYIVAPIVSVLWGQVSVRTRLDDVGRKS